MLFVLLLGVFLVGLVFLSHALSKPLPKPTPEQLRARRIGALTGLLGGDFKDAALTRFALDRSGKDPAKRSARDEGTAASLTRELGD